MSSFTEYKTVEKEIFDHLQTQALGWHYASGERVTADLRGGDEQEMLLIPQSKGRTISSAKEQMIGQSCLSWAGNGFQQ